MCSLFSNRSIAAVDGQDDASDKVRLLRKQEFDGAPDVIRPAPAAHRRARQDGSRFLIALNKRLSKIGRYPPRCDRVHADSILRPGGSEAFFVSCITPPLDAA